MCVCETYVRHILRYASNKNVPKVSKGGDQQN